MVGVERRASNEAPGAPLRIPTATVHDFRRTVGTNLARLGVSKDMRARLLNYDDGARSVTDAVYNQHELWAEKRAALMLWEVELRRIIARCGLPAAPQTCRRTSDRA